MKGKKKKAPPRRGRRALSKKAKLKLSYTARALKGWATRRKNQEQGTHSPKPSTRKVKKSSKTKTVKSVSREGKPVTIHKRIIKLLRSIKVDEFNAVPELEYHLFDRLMEAYDSLKKSGKKLNLFNFSILFKGSASGHGVIDPLVFAIGNANIQNKSQFKLYFRQVISRFAEKLNTYAGRGLSLYVSGAILDGINKTQPNKKGKKAKTVRRRRP